ncbi:MAG TPA: hypothetical protein VNN17_04955 [Terriglobia bacterium]|nr:hypothetical protein [Terriglobia bacterium]
MAKTLFPDMEEIARQAEFTRWLAEAAAKFRAAYPASKRSTHPERLLPRMRAALEPRWKAGGLEACEQLFAKAMKVLEVQKLSERWADPAFIPHLGSWWGGRYYEHDLKQYRPSEASRRRMAAEEIGRQGRTPLCGRCGRNRTLHQLQQQKGAEWMREKYGIEGICGDFVEEMRQWQER